MKTQVPPTGTFDTRGGEADPPWEPPPPPALGGVCEQSEASGAGAGDDDDGDGGGGGCDEEFVAAAEAASAAPAFSPFVTSVTEKVCCCCCCCWEEETASLLLLRELLELLARFPPPPPATIQVKVGAPSTTALVPAGLAFLSEDPPSIATASERRKPREAIAGGGVPVLRMGPILAARGSCFSDAVAVACGVGVRVNAKVVAFGGPVAVYSIVPARDSMEVQGLLLLAAPAEPARRRSRAAARSLCFFVL